MGLASLFAVGPTKNDIQKVYINPQYIISIEEEDVPLFGRVTVVYVLLGTDVYCFYSLNKMIDVVEEVTCALGGETL